VVEGNETASGKKASSGGSGKVVEDKVAKEGGKKVSLKKVGADGKKDLDKAGDPHVSVRLEYTITR